MENPGFARFVGLDERDAPCLLQRVSTSELPVDGERYGVFSRLIAAGDATVPKLAAAVLEKLCEQSSRSPERIGAIVLSSRLHDVEQAAAETVSLLGWQCESAGIERACSGFPAAVRLAIERCRQTGKAVAVVAAEIISPSINWEPVCGDESDHQRARGQASKLFADGAAAVLVIPRADDPVCEILDAWSGTVPDRKQLIQKTNIEDSMDPWGAVRPGATECMSMPGRRGFLLLRTAPEIMAESMRASLQTARDRETIHGNLAHVVPHQANGLILDELSRRIADEYDRPPRVWNCIRDAGNTVSASIPLAMVEAQEELKSGQLVSMPSVGAGGPGYRPDVLSTGCVLARVL